MDAFTRLRLWVIHQKFKWRTRKGQNFWITYSDDSGKYIVIIRLKNGGTLWSKHYLVSEAAQGRGVSSGPEEEPDLFKPLTRV